MDWCELFKCPFLLLAAPPAPPNVKEVWGCSGQEGTRVLRATLSEGHCQAQLS